jgi:YidC/Oxa1 family membrane protein insertase
MDQRNAFIAVVISIIIMLVYQEVILRRLYPPPAHQDQTNAEPEGPSAAKPPPQEPAPSAAESAPPAPAAPPAAPARRVTVDSELYTAIFTSKGARLESFRLKRYRTTVDPNSPFQETVVPGQGDELPLGVELRGAHSLPDTAASYTVEGNDLNLKPGDEGSVDFVWRSDSSSIRKHFVFHGDRYEFAASVSVSNTSRDYNEFGVSWPKGVDTPPQPNSEIVFDRAVLLERGKLVENTFDKLSAGQIISADDMVGWAGYAGRHFLVAMAPGEGQRHRVWLKLRDHTVEEELLFPLTPETSEQELTIYIGPKDFDALELVGHNLSRAVNLGWFGFIAVPLLHVLKLSHGFSRNYGLDIILLTVVLKILFIPLTQQSFKSMRAMQKLKPQQDKIRERYKDNQEQMNKEIMELYRRHGVNPLGGCLPMILQIPVFIGLYSALGNAVELRHAPFMLWINDLSAPDRLGSLQLPFVQHPGIPVLTLLMGGSMFVQQWMTPAAGDPAQQRMMMIMPLMFTFMFINFPSGLALYWLVNNLLTIAQQYYMNRTAP